MNLMEVEAVVGPVDGAQKIDLIARIRPKQCEMDWEQFNWVRSVKASDRQIKVTVNFS